jgi:phage-related holin
VASWLVFNEIISILENLKTVGVPLPRFLLKIVEFFRKKVEDIGDAATPSEEEGKNAESH